MLITGRVGTAVWLRRGRALSTRAAPALGHLRPADRGTWTSSSGLACYLRRQGRGRGRQQIWQASRPEARLASTRRLRELENVLAEAPEIGWLRVAVRFLQANDASPRAVRVPDTPRETVALFTAKAALAPLVLGCDLHGRVHPSLFVLDFPGCTVPAR